MTVGLALGAVSKIPSLLKPQVYLTLRCGGDNVAVRVALTKSPPWHTWFWTLAVRVTSWRRVTRSVLGPQPRGDQAVLRPPRRRHLIHIIVLFLFFIYVVSSLSPSDGLF